MDIKCKKNIKKINSLSSDKMKCVYLLHEIIKPKISLLIIILRNYDKIF